MPRLIDILRDAVRRAGAGGAVRNAHSVLVERREAERDLTEALRRLEARAALAQQRDAA